MTSVVVRPLQELILEHRPFVRASLRHLGVETCHVDDAEQEVFLVVVRRQHDFDPTRGTSERGWIWGICRKIAAAHRRAKLRREAHAPMELGRPQPMDERIAATQALATLDEDSRLLWLGRCEGHSARELAVALDLPLTTVQWRIRRAKHVLTSWLRDAGRCCNTVAACILRPTRIGASTLAPSMLGVATTIATLTQPQAPLAPKQPVRTSAVPAAVTRQDLEAHAVSKAPPRPTTRTPSPVVLERAPTVRPAKSRRRTRSKGHVSLGEPRVRPPALEEDSSSAG